MSVIQPRTVPVRFECLKDSGGYGYVYLGDGPAGPAETHVYQAEDDAPSIEVAFVVDVDAEGALLGVELASAWQSLPEIVEVPTSEFGQTVDAQLIADTDSWQLFFGAHHGEAVWLVPDEELDDDAPELGVIVSEGGRLIGITARGTDAIELLPAVYR